ncbi:DNA modification methylase [Microbacterium sp. BWT-B31]|uniref:DNA modification methylase n=1 Tax=Microbacterium sp. BWT-B31 TaxID=3232072 RepID=UPI003528BE5A
MGKSRLIASLAVTFAVAVATTGCSMLAPQATTIPYSPSDGVNVPDSGPLEVRNALIVADEDGRDGNLIAAIVNDTDRSQTLTIEFGEPAVKATVPVPARSVVSLGTEREPLLLEGIDADLGSNLEIHFQSGDHTGALVAVPVLDGTLPYLADLAP